MKKENEDITVDLESRLKSYLPIIFELLNEQKLTGVQWKKLNNKFIKEHRKRLQAYEKNGGHLIIESNLYDTITKSLKGDLKASMLLAFIKKTLEELTDKLTVNERKKLRVTIYNLLTSSDSKYFNYLAELLVLNNLLNHTGYFLAKIESQIVNDKTADFLFKKHDGSESHLIEVVSIHLDDSKDLKQHITKKLLEKLDDKRNGEKTYNAFTLIPVIWAPYDLLRKVEHIYIEDPIIIDNVAEPTAFAMFTYPDNKIIYRFGNITTLFSIMTGEHTFIKNNSINSDSSS